MSDHTGIYQYPQKMSDNLYEVLAITTMLVSAADPEDAVEIVVQALSGTSRTDGVRSISFDSSTMHAVEFNIPVRLREGFEPGE